jgi:multidrug efflux pump
MNISEPFVRRPIGTLLLTIGVAMAGIGAFFLLPVANLPPIDIPTIQVQANLPGASPETMATSVAGPLERHLAHISGVTEMTSQSRVGTTGIALQFDLSRNIDGAARDVQAAIEASTVDLPSTLRTLPVYRKINPAAAPIVVLALTSDTKTSPQIYDSASNIVVQKLSQISGVGEVDPMGASLPAVRVELNPKALYQDGIGLEDVRAAITSANAHLPIGVVQDGSQRLQIYSNDSGITAADYQPLVIAYRNGAAVRLSDIAAVVDGQEDVHNLGLFDGRAAVIVQVISQPGANIIATVDAIKATLPELQEALPRDIKMDLAVDRTTAIRTSLTEVEKTLLIATLLVVAVVAVFLRSMSATVVPAVAVVVSLLGTLGVMLLLGFSLDNLSLMALTVSTGFVVDDAIVVLENITRHVEQGMPRFEAALTGAKEVGFTVISISASLIAVFTPVLLMGGIPGRLFHEFALTVSTAIVVSLVISLTTTPMLCAWLVNKPKPLHQAGFLARWSEKSFDWMTRVYQRSLIWALDSGPVIIVILIATIGLNIYLYAVVPKGFFPQQSGGALQGFMQTDQDASFRPTQMRLRQFVDIIHKDPSVDHVTGFTGGRAAGGAVIVNLKPIVQRTGQESDDDVITRLRRKMFAVIGATLYLQSPQGVQAGGRTGYAQYQYTLTADDPAQLKTWATKLYNELKKHPDQLPDVNFNGEQDHGLESYLTLDRDTAARFGLSAIDVDNNLYDAFGQRQVSVIYKELNQYHVIMEVAPAYSAGPYDLDGVFISTNQPSTAAKASVATAANAAASAQASANAQTSAGAPAATTSATASNGGGNALAAAATTFAATPGGASVAGGAQIGVTGPTAPDSRNAANGVAVSQEAEGMVPLKAFARYAPAAAPTQVSHQEGSVATTISFNLQPGASLSDAVQIVGQAESTIQMPATVVGSFEGTAKQFTQSLSSEPILILVALLAIYITLGVLYESYVHPLTVLSTLPSAGVGASMALILFNTEFSLISFLGVLLLIGIVKKNAIMIIDFAIDGQRAQGLTARDAIYQACMLRFRPIMMTTFAAILGALPLVIASGEGSELRRPLGITIIGGLVVSQMLTLLTTPVVYLYLDRLRRRRGDESHLSHLLGSNPASGATPLEPEPV